MLFKSIILLLLLVVVNNAFTQALDTSNMTMDTNTTYYTTENPPNGTNSSDYSYDYYYYDFNATESNSTNQTTTPEITNQILFTGDNQTRPGLGINLGTITSGMSQWVFTNKFKHANRWQIVASRNNWFSYSFGGRSDTEWDSDGYPVNFTYISTPGTNLGYQTQLGTDGVYPTGDYFM